MYQKNQVVHIKTLDVTGTIKAVLEDTTGKTKYRVRFIGGFFSYEVKESWFQENELSISNN